MTWFKVDDDFYDHPKIKAIPKKARPGAIALWTMAGSWCARYLMDGLIPEHQIAELGFYPRDAEALVTAGLWHATPDGSYQYHDWTAYQPSRAQVEEEREKARKRMRRRRSSSEQDDGSHANDQ